MKLIDMLFSVNRASGGKGGIKGDTLEDDENSDEGDEEDYTVYECHGLAPVSSSQNILIIKHTGQNQQLLKPQHLGLCKMSVHCSRKIPNFIL